MIDHTSECRKWLQEIFFGPSRHMTNSILELLDAVASEWAKDREFAQRGRLLAFMEAQKLNLNHTSDGWSVTKDGVLLASHFDTIEDALFHVYGENPPKQEE